MGIVVSFSFFKIYKTISIDQNVYSYSLDLDKKRASYVYNPNIISNTILNKMGIVKNNFQNLVDFLETFPLEIGQWIYECLIQSKKVKSFHNKKKFIVTVSKKNYELEIIIGKSNEYRSIVSFYTANKLEDVAISIPKNDFKISKNSLVVFAFKLNSQFEYEIGEMLFSFIARKGKMKNATWKIVNKKLIIISNAHYNDNVHNIKYINKIFTKLQKNSKINHFYIELIAKTALIVESSEKKHNISKIEQALDYLLHKSTIDKEIKSSLASNIFIDKEFLNYQNNLYLFEKLMHSNKMSEKKHPIIGLKVNGKKAYHVAPFFDKISSKDLNVILNSYDNKNKLLDSFAKNISKVNENVYKFIDVNRFWFLKNFHLIKPSKNIYTIILDKHTDLNFLEKTILSLTQGNILIAIKLTFLSKDTITFISKSRPQFIIIDKEMTSGFTRGENIDVGLTLFSMMKQLRFELIFEFVDKFIDWHLKKKLHINSLYSLD